MAKNMGYSSVLVRALRDDARAKVASGIDPGLAKQRNKVAAYVGKYCQCRFPRDGIYG
jgi:hypothetical protein